MITKILSRRVGVFPLVSIVPMMFCKQRQIALVSAKVIKMIANESQSDKGTLASKLNRISPAYFSRLSKWESIKDGQIKQICQQIQYEMTPHYFRHFMSVEENRGHEEKIIAFLETQPDKQEIVQKLKSSDGDPYSTLTEENVEEVKILFTKGKTIQKCFRSQQRIQRGQQDSKDENKEEEKQNVFTFHPASIVTSQIFNHLLSSRIVFAPIQIYQGHYGIGKTAAFILFTLLMNNVTNYAVNLEQRQLKQFKKQLNIPLRKIIYWSFKDDYEQKQLKQHILMQCPEILSNQNGKSQFLKLELPQFCSQIKLFYARKDIDRIVITDQINKLASLFREHNQKYYQQNVQLSDDDKAKKTKSQTKLQQFSQWRMRVAGIGNYKIYNSSKNLQRQIIGSNSKIGLGMQISGHQKAKFFSLPYSVNVNTPKGAEELCEYWVFECRRQNIRLTEEDKQNVKQTLQKMQFRGSVTFLQISEALEKYKNTQQAIKNLSKQVETEINTKISKFNFKVKSESNPLFFINLIELINKKLSAVKSSDIIMIRKQEIQKLPSSQSGPKSQHDFLDKFLDKNIFNQHPSSYESVFPKSIMLRMLHQIYSDKAFLVLFEKTIRNFGINPKNSSLFGQVFQFCLIKALKSLIDYGVYPIYKYGENINILPIQRYSHFISINSKNTQNNMREFITKIKQTPNQYWLGIPFDPKTNDESLTGFYTDFCIAKYAKVIKQQKEEKQFPKQSKKSKQKALETQYQYKYEFTFFDVKTGDTFKLAEKEKKIQKLREILKNQIPSQNIKFVVLCSEKVKAVKRQSQPSFEFSAIKDLSIIGGLKNEDLKIFNKLKELYEKNYTDFESEDN